jgi:N-acetylglutamate synthase-like GNAT family acetyltransferase
VEGIHSPEPVSGMVSLRKASNEDLAFLFGVSTEAMKPVVQILNPNKIFDQQEELKKYKEKFKPEEIDIIQYEGRDVGRLRVVRSEESIYVGGIQLLPQFQHKGIGTSVFSGLIQESEQSGLPITLEVHDVNKPAISFYEKLGFEKGQQVGNQTIMRYSPRSAYLCQHPEDQLELY